MDMTYKMTYEIMQEDIFFCTCVTFQFNCSKISIYMKILKYILNEINEMNITFHLYQTNMDYLYTLLNMNFIEVIL